ncbi:MAG: cupin domain-containing protein [Nanoarchaeota archaeon]|nr:cupin domain-containing protein [Nanoarchaeota archaeon]
MKPKIREPTEEERETAESWPIWEKERSTFPWSYEDKETCLIIEGKAVIQSDAGESKLKAGDWVIFPKGLECEWDIKEKIKKHYKFG